MTVPVSDRLSQLYVGNGTNTRFDFTFRVFQQEDATGVAVRKKGEMGFETVDPSLYLVTANPDGFGGYIDFIEAPTSNTYFYIAGSTPIDQLLDITNYDNFYPDAIEQALDKLTALLQEWGTSLSLEKQERILADIAYDQLAIQRENDLKAYLENLINLITGVDFLPIKSKDVSHGPLTQEFINDLLIDPETKKHLDKMLVTWSNRTQEQKNKERVSPFDYQAAGNGVTDDTAKFKEIEATETTKSQIDLAGATYAIKSIWADPENGVVLTKDYVNGTLLVDGRKLVFDKNQNFAASAASLNRLGQASTAKTLGVKRNSENNYEIWRPLGGQYWQQIKLNRTANNVPLNWQETRIKQVLGYICAEDGNTYSGTWATLDTVSGLSDGSGNLYVGGRARQAQAAGDYVEIPYVGGGDIYVLFAGRTSGNYVNVLLDNAKDYLVLPDDGSGNKYFDSYTAADLQYKQLVKIASGVPNGNHTIRLTVSSLKNSASTGGRFVFNAIAFDGPEMGPWRSQSDAKLWKTGEAILLNQVRKHGANYYYATVAGTTGATPPTHTSGAVSDGGVTWTYRAITSYDLVDSAIQVAGSQLEYAYEMKPLGATAKEDVGGAMHGNEVQTALSIYVGNNKANLIDNTWLTGDLISFKEENYSFHTQIGSGTVPIVKTTLLRTFKRQWVEMYQKHTMQMQVELGYFYPHMWPLLHYHGPANKYAVLKFWSPGDGDRLCANFYGQNNPFVGRTKDTVMVAYGDCLQPNGSGGVPTTQPAPFTFAAWLAVDPSSVGSYKEANRLFMSKAMNTSGADASGGGFSSMTSKMYFERYSSVSPKTLESGESFECFARYGLDIFPKV